MDKSKSLSSWGRRFKAGTRDDSKGYPAPYVTCESLPPQGEEEFVPI